MEDTSQPLWHVKEPFDGKSGGDFILRTSDQAQFVVHRTILTLASPAFLEIFSILQPASHQGANPPAIGANSIPIIDVTEDAATLDVLLRCIYPTDKPTIDDIELAIRLSQAADKYLVPASCLTPIYFCLQRGNDLENDPHLRYALAWRMGYKTIAIQASHDILTDRATLMDLTTIQRVTQISGDVQALDELFSAKLGFDKNLRSMTTMTSLRWSQLLCPVCLTKPNEMENFCYMLRDGLIAAIAQVWLTSKGVAGLGIHRLTKFMREVESDMEERRACPMCYEPSTGLDRPPPISNIGYGMRFAAAWPEGKPDQTP